MVAVGQGVGLSHLGTQAGDGHQVEVHGDGIQLADLLHLEIAPLMM